MESLSDIVAQMRGRGEDGRMDRRLWLDYADRIEAAWKREKAARHSPGNAAAKRERDEMLDALVRIGNWCAQDLAENTYVSDSSGNYLKTLNGLCEVCRPFMQKARRLKRYGGAE